MNDGKERAAISTAQDNRELRGKDTQKTETSYLEQRLSALGITDEENRIKVLGYPDWRTFTEDGKGNIRINYLALDGQPFTYMGGRKEIEFARTRYQNPKDPKHKYDQPKGTETFPFFTPTILKKYKAKETIKTLVVTEGEFKAYNLSMLDVPCVGIGGIQNYKNKDKDKLHPDLIQLLNVCHVENVVLLFDRDCLEVKWEDGKDLATRPNNFFSALNTFNELLKPYDKQLYFSRVSLKCKEKGIDDLLCRLDDSETEQCLSELQSLLEGTKNRHFVETNLITGISSNKIKAIFGLNHVQEFYDLYKDELENHDFIYRGIEYYIKDGKPVPSWKGEENQYIRVGTDYYKLVVEKSPNEQTELNIKPWKIGTIKSDYHKPNEFLKQVKKYDAFTNIPENDPEKYERTVISKRDGFTSVLYNRYFPVSHIPQEGQWPIIEKFLHHIFDYKNLKGVTFYEMILDYLQIVYLHPTQHLPILCLVSSEQATGKSKFLELLRSIFLENMRILDSERISSKFNGSWAGKLLVAVDESFIDTDKPTVVNRLKMIATNNTIPIEEKGKEAGEVPNFSKLIMCSNDETNFLKIEIEETRYWIIRVKSIDPATVDTHIIEKMEKEIPAFLWFLKNRTLHYKEASRLWFDPDDYATDALRLIQERTAPMLERHIKECIKQQFRFQMANEIRLSLAVIYDLVREHYPHANKMKISDHMANRGYKLNNPSTFTYYLSYEGEPITKKDRFYLLRAQDWLTNEELNGKTA